MPLLTFSFLTQTNQTKVAKKKSKRSHIDTFWKHNFRFRDSLNLEYRQQNLDIQYQELRTLKEQRRRLRASSASILQIATLDTEIAGLQRSSKQLKQFEKDKFSKVSEKYALPENRNMFIKMISSISKRAKRSGCFLDSDKLEEYTRYFERTTFGIEPEGQASEQEMNVLQNSDPTVEDQLIGSEFMVTPDSVKLDIKWLARGKSPGDDGIYNEMLQAGGDIVSPVLTTFFNLCSTLHTFPKTWRKALIHPIFKKKGEQSDIKNYRHIALTNTIRKLYEKSLLPHVHRFDFALSGTQGGFRTRRSTMKQIAALEELCRKHPNLYHAFLDIKTAYDTVDRRLLWTRMSIIPGMTKDLIGLLRGLMDFNRCSLVVNGKQGRDMRAKRGLLQGSPLSPILFNHFINDLLVKLKEGPMVTTFGVDTNHLFFADDGALHAESRQQLETLISICESWSRRNGLQFSPPKCVVMCRDDTMEPLQLYGTALPCVAHQEYLGIIFENDGINWEKTMAPRIAKLKQMATFLNSKGMSLGGWRPSSCLMLFKIFLRPVMEYGLALDVLPKEILDSMQKAQNQALRKMLSAAHTTSIAGMHVLLNVPPIEFRNKHLMSKFYANLARLAEAEVIDQVQEPVIVDMFKKQSELPQIQPTLLGKVLESPYWDEIQEIDYPTTDPPAETTPELSSVNEVQLHLRKIKLTTNNCVGKLQKKYIHKMVKRRGNVADNIQVSDNKKAHKLVTSEWIHRKTQTHLIFWRLGRVAYHQDCLNCTVHNRQELSREHALDCANVKPMIRLAFPQLPDERNRNMMDIALDHLAYHSDDIHQLNTLADAVVEIKKKCLKWRVNEEGQLVSPSNESYPQSE